MAVPTANVVPLRPDGEDWPTPPQPAAFTGLAGDIVRAIEPHTESDPVAVLVQLLVAFGSVIGRGAHYAVEATRHHSNEFVVLVGPSAKARKGSSWDHVERIFAEVDPVWVGKRTVSGLSSGEGLIWNVRDNPADDDDHSRQGGDKRLLVLEAEFAAVLKMTARDGSTLSPVVRNAWDGKALQTLTKNSPARATGAHVSIIGHITADELVRMVTATVNIHLPDRAESEHQPLNARHLLEPVVWPRTRYGANCERRSALSSTCVERTRRCARKMRSSVRRTSNWPTGSPASKRS